MKEALSEIARLARIAVNSDGGDKLVFLDEFKVFELASAGMNQAGTDREAHALQAIVQLIEPALTDEDFVLESDILDLAEEALAA